MSRTYGTTNRRNLVKKTVEMILAVIFLLVFCRCSTPAPSGTIEKDSLKVEATAEEKLLNAKTRYVYFNKPFHGNGYSCTPQYEGYGDVRFKCTYAFDPSWISNVYANIHSSDEVHVLYPEPNAPEFVFTIRGHHNAVGSGMLIYDGVLP